MIVGFAGTVAKPAQASAAARARVLRCKRAIDQ
jgi:hypothetical protein